MATLPANPAALTLNEVAQPGGPDHAFRMLANPALPQSRAFGLLEIDPASAVAM